MRQAGYAHFSVPNDLLCLSVLSPFALYSTVAPRRYEQWLGFGTLLAVVACLTMYETRGGLFLLALGVVLFFMIERPRFIPALALLAIAFWFFGYTTGFALLDKLSRVETLAARLPVWLTAWRMFLDDPWLGQGPGAFALLYPRYAALLDPSAWPVFDPRHMPWAHHLYLELLSERGVLGLSAFTFLLAGVVPLLRRPATDRIERPERYRTIGATVIALTLTAIGGLFELSLLRYWFVIVLSLLISIPMAYSQSAMGNIRCRT